MAAAKFTQMHVNENGQAIPLFPVTDYNLLLNKPVFTDDKQQTVYTDTGTATAMMISIPDIEQYSDLTNKMLFIKKNLSNGSGTSMTLKVNSLTAISMHRGNSEGAALTNIFEPYSLSTGQLIATFYDGSKFVLMSTNAPDRATTAEAQAGTSTAVFMTPARTKEAITALTPNRNVYGECATNSSVSTKTVSLSGFTLSNGSIVTVRFSNTNTASSPALDVGGTGAKAMYSDGVRIGTDNQCLIGGRVYAFSYNASSDRYELISPAKATQEQAEAGTLDTVVMTPARVKNAIDKFAPTLTKATKIQAEAGTDDAAYMTALRTKEAISKLAPGSVTSISGNAGTATQLQTAKEIVLTGDVVGSVSFDGSKNVSISTSLSAHTHSSANITDFEASVRAAKLTGLSASLGGNVEETDSILVAIGKLKTRLNAVPSAVKTGSVTFTDTIAAATVTLKTISFGDSAIKNVDASFLSSQTGIGNTTIHIRDGTLFKITGTFGTFNNSALQAFSAWASKQNGVWIGRVDSIMYGIITTAVHDLYVNVTDCIFENGQLKITIKNPNMSSSTTLDTKVIWEAW